MKSTYKIIITIITVILIMTIVYFIWQRLISNSQSLKTKTNNAPLSSNELPSSIKEILPKLYRLSDHPVFDYGISYNTNSIFYLTPEGKIYKLKSTIEEKGDLLISNQIIKALNKIEFSLSGEKILTFFDNPLSPKAGIFDLIDKIWRPLPSEILNATWQTNNNELVGILFDEKSVSLSILNITKNPPEKREIIKDFRLKDINLIYVGNNNLIITEKPSIKYQERSWLFNLKDSTIQNFINGSGLVIKKANNLLFVSSLDTGFLIFNEELKQIKNSYDINTLPLKCNTTENKIFCFIPDFESLNSLETTAIFKLLDDYLTGKVYTVDSLMMLEFDPSTQEIKNITYPWASTPNEPVDALNPQYFNDYLYFINRYDGYLYALRLNA